VESAEKSKKRSIREQVKYLMSVTCVVSMSKSVYTSQNKCEMAYVTRKNINEVPEEKLVKFIPNLKFIYYNTFGYDSPDPKKVVAQQHL